MSYIYDSFPSLLEAAAFGMTVQGDAGVTIYTNAGAAIAADPTPAALEAPIVHVTYEGDTDVETEEEFELAARAWGGRYVGT